MHVGQSYESAVELEEITAVPHQIITPRDPRPIIGVVQDTLVGSYRLTRPVNQFNLREYMNLMMYNKRFDGSIPKPREGSEAAPRWTGHQVISRLLPPLNLEMANGLHDSNPGDANFVKIREGDVLQGTFDKGIFSKSSKGIIHTTYNDYGAKQTVDLIDSMQHTIESYLILNGFSVGISDLVADEKVNLEMQAAIEKRKKEVAEILLQIHLDLFNNNTGKTNQQELEDRVFGALNKATDDSGKIGQDSLAPENRMIAMVRAGSKGGITNIAQMMACVGQQAVEGKRIPYGYMDRTLPHYKKYDDGAEARGFVESSFLRGLTPQEFFFHAMSGREGLIDTAVKSVTGDTELVLMEDGQMKHITIGEWVDRHLSLNSDSVQSFEENNMEYLDIDSLAYIPTTDANGTVSWGEIKAVTRHDPGKQLYQIKTLAGKEVTVTAAQSLLVWDIATKQFLPKLTPEVSTGDFVPVTASLPAPPVIIDAIDVAKYLLKTEYVYGSDFNKAVSEMNAEMSGRAHIPSGWWAANNGSTFTLPYDSKARLQRATVRSNMNNIAEGYVYPFTTNRDHTLIPDKLPLNAENGLFMGLFLAEGNADIKSGYVQITNNDVVIRKFVKSWFATHSIRTSEEVKTNHIGGTSSCIRGYSVLLAKLLTALMGHGAEHKRVPSEAFAAPTEFVVALLNGYFSGDGTITNTSVEASSASSRLIDGISMLCTRIGVFGKVFTTKCSSNNIGTVNILPAHRIAIRAQWVTVFANKVTLIHNDKQQKLNALTASNEHRNFTLQNDVVLDTITEINLIDPAEHPKMYDLTIPSTLNFGLANGLQVRDTADTGYIQRQLVKAMEDIVIQHDGSVRDAAMNVVQFHYGEDGTNSTKLESQPLPLAKLTERDIETTFGMTEVDFTPIFEQGIEREADGDELKEFIAAVIADRKMLVEGVFGSGVQGGIFSPVNIERLMKNIEVRFGLDPKAGKTDLTPLYVLQGITKLLNKTQDFNRIWAALLRFHLAPHNLIVKRRYTRKAFDTLIEMMLVKNWQSWAQPGELVGILAAQSIGEPSTQMTLNTFHLAGVAAKSNVTRGVPRLKELLKVTQNPKATSLTVYLKPEYRESKEKAREVAQDLEMTLLRDIVLKSAIYYDPSDTHSVIAEDRELLEFYKLLENTAAKERNYKPESKYVLRMEFDREKMFNKNITMNDVAFILQNKAQEIHMIYSDYNSKKLVMRVRIMATTAPGQLDYLEVFKRFQNNLLNTTVIRGVPGIKAVTFRQDSTFLEDINGEYKNIQQYILDTDGSNYMEVMNHPAVDANRLYSTNVHDIHGQYGVEAARATLLNEITNLFEEVGINYRHLGLLCDVMTRGGKLMSVDRFGINKNDIGPIAKASFEETENILLKAALYGEVDPVTGVSANIMMGQPIRGGTAFSQIMLDEQVLPKLLEGLAPIAEIEEEGDEMVDLDELLERDAADACGMTKIQANITLPTKVKELIAEDDVELEIL